MRHSLKIISLFCLQLIAVGASKTENTMEYSFESNDEITYKTITIGNIEFKIPASFVISQPNDAWYYKILGLDTDKSASLTIPANTIIKKIHNYEKNTELLSSDLYLRINPLSDFEFWAYSKNPEIMTYIANPRYHATKSEQGYILKKPHSDEWYLFSVEPAAIQDKTDVFSFWLGTCADVTTTQTQSGHITRCDSYAAYDKLIINFTVYGENISLIPEIREYIKNQLSEWKLKK